MLEALKKLVTVAKKCSSKSSTFARPYEIIVDVPFVILMNCMYYIQITSVDSVLFKESALESYFTTDFMSKQAQHAKNEAREIP